jgi:hypothetical protein
MFSGAAYHWRSNTGANVYCAGVGQCLIGQGFALASSALRKMLGIELPDALCDNEAENRLADLMMPSWRCAL